MLFDQLATKSYDAQAAAQWSKVIADTIETKMKGNIYLSFLYAQFKFILLHLKSHVSICITFFFNIFRFTV